MKKILSTLIALTLTGCTVNTQPNQCPPCPCATTTPTPTVVPTATPTPAPTASNHLQVGVNLGSPSYWDAQSMYADVTAYTSGWWADNIGLTPAQIQPFSVTADNYPTTDAQVLSNFVGYLSGLYRISFDHNANTRVIIGWSENFKTPPQGQIDSAADSSGVIHTSYQLQLTAGNPIMIYVHRVNPALPSFLIKNLHILSPDASGSFRAPFLSKIAPFNPIRMMGMNNTNDAKTLAPQSIDCPAKNWADRTVLSNFSRSNNSQVYGAPARDGATYEEEIELGNILHKDLWINIPDCASDDFVTQLATLFHSQLSITSKLYIEYSNETWNTGFGQWSNIRDFSKTVAPVNAITDDVTRVQVYTAYRLMQIMKIFQGVFSDRKSQIQGVLAGQLANTWTVSVGLDYLKTNVGDPKQWIQWISGAPYVGPVGSDWASYDAPMQAYFHDSQTALQTKAPADQAKAAADLESSFAALFASMSKWQTTYNNVWFAQWKTMQTTYGIPVIGYEGGQSLVSAFASLQNQNVIQSDGSTKTGQTVYYQYDPMHLAQSDPRMVKTYDDLMNGWQANFGSQPFVHLGFVAAPSNWGFWGLWESLDQAHSVKGDEVLKLNGN